jgi:uncharacterized protein YbcI
MSHERERKRLQHELKLYMEKYFKTKLGKGVDHTRVTIWEDLMIIRGQGFLTEPEKYIASSAAGQEVVSSARMHVAKQHSADNTPYFERLLQAQVLHEAFLVDAKKDFWLHVMVFDRVLTE